jgi:hypothetical protein
VPLLAKRVPSRVVAAAVAGRVLLPGVQRPVGSGIGNGQEEELVRVARGVLANEGRGNRDVVEGSIPGTLGVAEQLNIQQRPR